MDLEDKDVKITIIDIVLYVQESRRKHDHNVERNVRY